MRYLLSILAVVAFAATDAEAGKRKRRKAPALQAGQTCKLKRSLKAFTKTKGKTLSFKKGVTVTLVKVGKKWVTVRSDEDVEGAVKVNKAFKKACKPTAAPSGGSEAEAAESESAAEPAPEPEPEPDPLPPMPETDVSADDGGEMALPDGGPKDTGAVGFQMAAPPKTDKVKPYDALDVLGTDGARTFAVERRSRRRTTRDWLGYGGLALGGVGLVTCGVLIGVSSGKAGELAEDIEFYNGRAVRSTAEADELEDRKRSVAALDIGAIAAGVVGLGAAGAGLYLLLTGDDESHAWVAPSASDRAVGVVVGGEF